LEEREGAQRTPVCTTGVETVWLLLLVGAVVTSVADGSFSAGRVGVWGRAVSDVSDICVLFLWERGGRFTLGGMVGRTAKLYDLNAPNNVTA
jgi:hypothetical protein